jgi:5-methylcytosine-specific restriction protein A
VAECAACDAVDLGSLDAATPERATQTVTPRKRQQVLARDGYGCVVPGCRRNIGLDVHHVQYQHHGGGHELRNLVTICDLHHRAVHFGKLIIGGTAPDGLAFEFRRPPDLPDLPHLPDDAPFPRAHVGAAPAMDAASAVGAAPAELEARCPVSTRRPVMATVYS